MASSSPLRAVAQMLQKGLIAADGSVAASVEELSTTQLRNYVRAMYVWNPTVVEESDFKGRGRADLGRFLASYAADPRLVNRARGVSGAAKSHGVARRTIASTNSGASWAIAVVKIPPMQ